MKSMVTKSVLLLSIVTTTAMTLLPFDTRSAIAQSDSNANCIMTPQDFIPPNTLAMMAFRGAFEKEGIPGYIVFKTEFNSGQITGDSIVKAAIEGCVLSNKYGMQGNSAYIADVQTQVQDFIRAQN
ncbi:hypothetical protein [Crocosphaera chwakensis]|uniref:Uncharacterized protein n=1 Tax=Crocosphaera chwakensis CCY0110 TaxID=391612 RepID=A3IRA8_9CHRO|nr:hypothetical protein [Crocosphaera chwakensis]EAZ90910.1 hypothetical protein CY0110_21020 [Crocosphaera chwakensis CCY0110]